MRTQLRKIVIDLRVCFVPFKILPIDQALYPLLQICWLDWEFKLPQRSQYQILNHRFSTPSELQRTWNMRNLRFSRHEQKQKACGICQKIAPAGRAQLLTKCDSKPYESSWSAQLQHQSAHFTPPLLNSLDYTHRVWELRIHDNLVRYHSQLPPQSTNNDSITV